MSDGIIRLRKTGVVTAVPPRAGAKPAWFMQLEGEAEAARGMVGNSVTRALSALRDDEDEDEDEDEVEVEIENDDDAVRFSGELDLNSLMDAARARVKAQARREAEEEARALAAGQARSQSRQQGQRTAPANARIGGVFLASISIGAIFSVMGITFMSHGSRSDASTGLGFLVGGIMTIVFGWWYAFKKA